MSSLVSEADSASLVRISLNMGGLRGSCRARQTWNDWLAYWWLEHDVAQFRAFRAHFSCTEKRELPGNTTTLHPPSGQGVLCD